ncbi:MarR family EPS-associated transcriptional regulator [Pelomonas sp. P7]|uniref:MarR family EPS-associated transcriptional regulator n=1 Tax=Pelomonas caseinilytica TaxID=2906763 RepID=A0ABS8XH72_9BURK|nr:MarR family EPS-associated transcriptional regulator [Pelomonas sp. P7]MCE4538186.1 MarR family EPS-associated transcriptional regulator [Pelomonas sp. P7]
MPERTPDENQHLAASSSDAAQLAALRLLASDPESSQRQVASALGISVGRTNYLLKALLEKGFVKVRNFRRSDNKLAYAYVLTPSGLSEKVRLTRAFIQRKELEFERLQQVIAELKHELDIPPAPEREEQK